ncbi:ribonuclease [Mycobacterium tuberculosis]|nr:ribonuclease [Mycobacterium tuberculosis]EFD55155.1 conserved hypothetical protein [Mycobacterium tuberculosis 02_1987]
MRALLDVNVLLALLDRDHVDHERARAWITGQIERGWASCAITQNGFVRVISQPRYPSPISVAHAIDLLARATHTRYHEFWSCTVSILDSKVIDRSRLHSPKQVTDAYLLALAVAHDGRFVTFDQSIASARASPQRVNISARLTSWIALVTSMPRGQDSVQLNVVRQRHTPSTSLRMSRRSAAASSRLSKMKRCALTIAAGPK